MNLLEFYLQTSRYTNISIDKDNLSQLGTDLNKLALHLRKNLIHRVTLKEGNTNANKDLFYGDMYLYPWHRMRCEDDVFITADSMLAELYRLDSRGLLTLERAVEDKLVVTCRNVAILGAGILKLAGIPSRCRYCFVNYFDYEKYYDHWLVEYYDRQDSSWKLFDIDEIGRVPNQFDVDRNLVISPAEAWINVRNGKADARSFVYDDYDNTSGLKAIARLMFYDLNALMNNELTYTFIPYRWTYWDEYRTTDLKDTDDVAELLLNFDENGDMSQLHDIWEHNKIWRLFSSPLVSPDEAWNRKEQTGGSSLSRLAGR